MPLVGVNNEPLLERAVFAYDGTDYRVVKCDATGQIVAALEAGSTIEVTQDTAADLKATVDIAAGQSVEVTQDTAADLKATVDVAANQNIQARGYGYDGSTWQKSPIPIGYMSAWDEDASQTASGATVTWDSGTVPSGEVWVLQAASFANGTRAPSDLRIICNKAGGTSIYLGFDASPAQYVPIVHIGDIALAVGDSIRMRASGCVSGDVLIGGVSGYKMEVS